jgi:hypothetical protein
MMRRKKTNRILALVTVIAVMVLSLPVQSFTFAEDEGLVVDVQMNKPEYFIGDADTQDPGIHFNNPSRADVSFVFDDQAYSLDNITDNDFYVYAPLGTVVTIVYTDLKDQGAKFENVKFDFGVNSQRYIWRKTDPLEQYSVTFGEEETFNVVADSTNDPNDDDGEVTGIVTFITSWKEGVSNDARLKSVEPETDPEVDEGGYSDEVMYVIWVEDLEFLPDLKPVPFDKDATVSDPTIIGSVLDDFIIHEITITAEDMITSKTYSFKFVKRDKPVITLVGDTPFEVLVGQEYEEPGASVLIHGGGFDEPIIDEFIDITQPETDDYVTYNYTDEIKVYKIDGSYEALEADEKIREIVYVAIEILDPVSDPIDTNGYTLYYGTAILEPQTADLGVFIPNSLGDPEVIWSLVEPDTGAITIVPETGVITAQSVEEQMIKVEVVGQEEIFDTALIKVLSNDIPIIDVDPVELLLHVNDDVTDYIMIGVTVTDTEDDFNEIDLDLIISATDESSNPYPVNDIAGNIGVYTILYEVTDSDNNHVEATRIVTVYEENVIIIDDPEATVASSGVILYYGYGKTEADRNADLDYILVAPGYTETGHVWSIFGDDSAITLNAVTGEVRGDVVGSATVRITVTLDEEIDVTSDVTVEVRFIETPIIPSTPDPTPPRRRTTVSIKLDRDPVELEYGSLALPELLSYDLTETITGSSDKRVSWSVGDETIATVDDEGVVTAVQQGETTVTVKHTASGKTDTSDVIVFLVGDEPTPLGQVEFYEPYVYGYPDQTFRPSNSVTRAEVATMFAKILRLNIDYSGTQQFNDVMPGTWYYNYVQAINRTNIFVGGSNGNFRPNEPITRAEMATVFGKFWEYLGTPVDNNNVSIADVTNNHWASNYIYMMYNAGIVTGFEDGSYRPEDPTLREHVVGMINTLIDRPAFDAPTSKFTDIDNTHWAFGNIEAASQPFNRLQNFPIPE